MKCTHTMAGAAAVLALALFWTSGPFAAEAGRGSLTNVNTPEREVLTNSDVVELVRAGLSPNVIRTMMLGSPAAFDTSPRAIIHLKENNVPDEVIQAMVSASPGGGPSQTAGGEGRVDRELANIASGDGEAKEIALAWFLANRSSSVEPLRRRLVSSDPDARGAAALALGRLGDSDSLAAIRPLIADRSANARALAAEALSLLNDRVSVTAAEQAVARRAEPLDGHIRLLGRAKLAPAADPIARILEDGAEANSRAAAAWALGEIGRAGVSGRPALERALSADVDPRVRREAVLALAKFRDAGSAEALQNACRVDPEVRKTVLVSLADYPESIGFLVEVMNIPPDQIAADEIEAARASLMRLTGRDYGLDGSGWTTWLAENGGSPPAPASQAAVPFDGLEALSGWNAGTAGRSPSEVDLEAWAILADSAHIPTTPPSGALSGASSGAGFSATSAPPAGSYASPSSPFSFSAPSVDASGSAALVSPASGGQTPFAPSHIPEVDIPDPQGGSSGLRTWSSDPGRVPPQDAPGAPPQPGVRAWGADSSRIAGGEPPAAAQPPSFFAPSAPTSEPPHSADADPRFSSPGLPAAQPAAPPGGIALPPPPGGIALPPPPADMSSITAEPDASWQSVSDSPAIPGDPPPPSAVVADPFATGEYQEGAMWQSVPEEAMAGQQDFLPFAPTPLDSDAGRESFSATPSESLPADDSSAGIFPTDSAPGDAYFGEQGADIWQNSPETGPASLPPPASDMIVGSPRPFESGFPASLPPVFEDGPSVDSAGVPEFDPSILDSPVIVESPFIMDGPVVESPGDAEAPPDTTQWGAAEPFTSPYFVDPEPGQVVIGDPIIFPDATTSIPDEYEYSQEYAPADSSERDAADFPPSEQYFELPEATDPFAAPSADAGVFSSPEAAPPPSQPAYETAAPPPPPPSGVMSTPDSFVDPSQPLPPVKQEGLIKAPTGKDQPPMLGEGFK